MESYTTCSLTEVKCLSFGMIILRFIHVVASFTGCQVIIHYMNIVIFLSIHLLMDIWMFLVWGYYKLLLWTFVYRSFVTFFWFLKSEMQASLVAMIKNHLWIQESRFDPLIQEDSTCLEEQLSLCTHKCWTCAWSPWSATREATSTWSPCTARRE